MEIRYINSKDSLLKISDVYEKSWKYAYKDIIPREYLDSIPEGQWAGNVGRDGRKSLVAVEDGKIIGTASFCKSRWKEYGDCGEIVSIYFLPEYGQRVRQAPV